MRDKPILFKSELIRAILDGRKTVTRRAMRLYEVGDILYVREAYGKVFDPKTKSLKVVYKADNPAHMPAKWVPGMHMPKELARLFLQVTDVRTERLLDITEAGARAEGCGSRTEFIRLWKKVSGRSDERYGEYLQDNPFVFVYNFIVKDVR